jgi:hypothetical protein
MTPIPTSPTRARTVRGLLPLRQRSPMRWLGRAGGLRCDVFYAERRHVAASDRTLVSRWGAEDPMTVCKVCPDRRDNGVQAASVRVSVYLRDLASLCLEVSRSPRLPPIFFADLEAGAAHSGGAAAGTAAGGVGDWPPRPFIVREKLECGGIVWKHHRRATSYE